jgi:hypothetical protein
MTDSCPKCGDLWPRDEHRCPPQWWCCEADDVEDPDERRQVYARDAGEAAEAFAEARWEGCPKDDESMDVAVWVYGSPVLYTVHASLSITFRARPRGE